GPIKNDTRGCRFLWAMRDASLARIVTLELLAQILVRLRLPRRFRHRRPDRQLHQLIARVRPRHATAFQPQLAPRLTASRDAQIHRAGQRRHRYRGTQGSFPRADRQHMHHVAAIQAESRIIAYADFQQQVALGTTGHTRLALSRQPDDLTGLDAGGNLHLQHALATGRILHGQSRATAIERRLQLDLHRRLHIATTVRARLATRAGGAPPTEQAFEEIAEIAAGVVETVALVLPARRWPELLAAAVAAGTQLVVGAALLRIHQHFLCLVGGLEFLLGTRFLVLVRVVFARQLPIRRLDLGLGRVGLDAQNVVIVFEFHYRSPTDAKPTADPCRRGCSCNVTPASSRQAQWPVLMVMRRGVASAFFGITISSTPNLPFAVMPSASALSG